jgi:hypothetical protein
MDVQGWTRMLSSFSAQPYYHHTSRTWKSVFQVIYILILLPLYYLGSHENMFLLSHIYVQFGCRENTIIKSESLFIFLSFSTKWSIFFLYLVQQQQEQPSFSPKILGSAMDSQ